MGPAPQLSTYESAAKSIYEPQKQAAVTAAQATDQATKNSLEAQKGTVNTTYQSAIDKLTASVQAQTDKISQLYNTRLMGMFSGLQGNDMGKMYSNANQSQSIIEMTRANALAKIGAAETNADIKMNSDIAALTPKYQGLEEAYAQKAYTSAVNSYNTQAYRQQQLGLSEARLANSQANTAYNQQQKIANEYKVTGKNSAVSTGGSGKGDTSQGYDFTGPHGEPISMAQYVQGTGGNAQDVVNLLQNGSGYDRWVLGNAVKSLGGANKFSSASDQQIMSAIAKADKGHYYGF